jgi:hypothetical protein
MNAAEPTDIPHDEASLQLVAKGNLRDPLSLKGLDRADKTMALR